MFTYEQLKPEYSHLWYNCKINSNKQAAFKQAANLILSGKDTYQDLETKTGVPWYFIGLVHLRESDCNFHTHLHNGDPLYRRTYHVPAGRPPTGSPPFTFEDSAIDALRYEGFIGITDWSAERICFCLEKYNGWGYKYHGVPSAYLWAGTNNYSHGKYVADNVWSSSAVDTQLGAMGVLATLEQLDGDVYPHYDGEQAQASYKAQPAAPQPDMTDSRKWNLSDIRQKATITVGTAVAGYGGMDASNISSLRSTVDSVSSFVHTYGIWMLLGGLALGFLGDYLLKKYMVQDVTSGRAIPSGSVPNVSNVKPV